MTEIQGQINKKYGSKYKIRGLYSRWLPRGKDYDKHKQNIK